MMKGSMTATIARNLCIVICGFLPKCRIANNHSALDRALIWIKPPALRREDRRRV
jgi:hypothetical protein